MSLLSFVKMPEVRERIKKFRPKFRRKIDAPLLVEPRTKRYQLVGTAFDYLLRFELQRRAPHAVSEQWVAEEAPDHIWRKMDFGSVGRDVLIGVSEDEKIPPRELAERVQFIVEEAKDAVSNFRRNNKPTRIHQEDMAAHAIRMAKLDSVVRAGLLGPDYEEADPLDVEDLVEMLAIVPFGSLIHEETMVLNPTFGDSSLLVDGADTDLITGELLIDLKVTKKNEMNPADLDQILGYLLLARHQRQIDNSFPVISQIGLYFCRHGYLWRLDAASWTDSPGFSEFEEWFFKKAKEVFGSPEED